MSAYEQIDRIENPTPLDMAVIFAGTLPQDDFEEDESEAAAQELLDLRANLAEAVALLKRVEFGGYEDRYTEFQGRHCPCCGGYMDEITAHESSCDLAAFLKRMEAE